VDIKKYVDTRIMDTHTDMDTGTGRDVNETGRVRVVTLSYSTCWINICPVPVLNICAGIRYASTRMFF